jgi:RND family efflux transporter MFP subunit
LWRNVRFFVRVNLARLRFIALLAVLGVVLTQWGTLVAHWEKWTRPASDHDHTHDPDSEFFCPMHPTVVRDNDKEKCPICLMPLSKRKKGAADEPLPAGVASRVQLTPYRVVLAGVRTSPVEYRSLTRDVTTVGTVEFDERAQRHVAARVKGRIDKLFANQTGQYVREGDPLAELYSPDLVVTFQNLLDARRSANTDLERIAADRLRLWGIDDDQVAALVKAGKPVTHLTVRSPISGHVTRKYPLEGQYVEEGGPLYDVADLSTVWVQAQVYEDDLAFLDRHARHDDHMPRRLPVTATTRAHPDREFAGNLSFVWPHVDRESRTLAVRFNLENPRGVLRPGMTATVRLKLGPEELAEATGGRLQLRDGKVLAVPESAVIDTGRSRLVYRQAAAGVFEGVFVELGPRLTGPDSSVWLPVYSGVDAGDEVVTAGSFLIDAETRLNPAAGSIYFGGSGGKSAPVPVRPSTPEDEHATIATNLARLSPADRALAEAQKTCPILGGPLGAMGVPVKVTVDGKAVFLCCKGCESKAKSPATPAASPKPPADPKAAANLARLSPADRALAETQGVCPITGEPLGSMGKPSKVLANGLTIFTCCKGCDKDVLADPEAARKKLDARKGKP